MRKISVRITSQADGYLATDDQEFTGTTEEFAATFGITFGAAMPQGDVSDGTVTVEWQDL